jgi:hypothetical protein
MQTLPDFQNALRPPDISDLLITSVRGSTSFPIHSMNFLLVRGMLLFDRVSISRYCEEDSPYEDGRILYHSVERGVLIMNQRLADLVALAGVSHQSGGYFSHHLHFWFRAFDKQMKAWAREVKSSDDLFARYETCDQVVEAILGEGLMKELLRSDLDPKIPSARPFAEPNLLYWHMKMAAGLLVAWQKKKRITACRTLMKAMFDSAPTSTWLTKESLNNSWYKTYHRPRQIMEV